jgi:replicative DNA helicase
LEYKLDLILVDYLQLMASDNRTENRVQEVSYISRNMKALAKELNIPVLAAAQLSRAAEKRDDKEFKLSDLRESGSLEQDADVVMFIQRETEKPNIAKIIVAKHRNGPTDDRGIELVFLSDLARFDNAFTRKDQSESIEKTSQKAKKE